MNIKNLPNHPNGKLNSVDASDQNRKSARATSGKPSESAWSDKVSIKQYSFRDNEELFAKTELDKFNKASFDKLKKARTELSEYESAKQISPEAAEKTEMGKKLHSPDVWKKIAERMTET